MSNDSGSSQLEHQVLFESNRPLEPRDIDILSLFLENKRQSGGGDILNVVPVCVEHTAATEDKANCRALKVTYEQADVQQRILAKKFFRFQEYFLRASECGYKLNQLYTLDNTRIILENISSSEEEQVIQLYAEYLLPENTVLEIISLTLFPNTYCVCYEEPVDMYLLQARYNKRTQLRNRRVDLSSAYKTNTLLIKAATEMHGKGVELIQNLLSQNFPQTLKSDTTPFMFFEVLKSAGEELVLCQFEDSNVELLARIVLKENGFIVDCCYNFDLVDPKRLMTNDCFKRDVPLESLCEKTIQTELDPTKTVREQLVKASINSLTEKLNKLKSSSPPRDVSMALKSSNPTTSTSITDSVLTLDPVNPYTIGLVNSKQTLTAFRDYLLKGHCKGLNVNMSLVELENQTFQLQVVNQSETQPRKNWKSLFLNELNKFFSKKATHRTVKIPDDICKSQTSMDILHATANDLNRKCPGVFFRVNTAKAEINGYGLRNLVKKQLDSIPVLFKSLTGQEKQYSPETSSKLYGSYLTVLIDSNSILNCVLANCKTIRKDFKKNIKELGAELIIETKGAEQSYRIGCLIENADPIKWTKGIYCLIENYETSRLKLKKLSIPPNLRKEKEMSDLKKHLENNFKLPINNLFYTLIKDSVNAQGYTAAVKLFTDNVHSKFNNLKNNINDRCRRKLDVRLDELKCPNIVMLGNAKGHYLKEFSNQLVKFEALVELISVDATKLKITCKLKNKEQENEEAVNLWRKNIDGFVLKYFAKFRTENVSFKQENEQSFSILLANSGVQSKIKTKWIDDNTVQITGLDSDVAMVKSALSKNQDKCKKETKSVKITEPSQSTNEMTSKAQASDVAPTVDTPPEETFQISDLKWFQTRMLFERKYFQFVSETYTKLSVMIDTNLTHIWYRGSRQDIEEAKSLAFDILDKILGTEVEADQSVLDKMTEREQELESIIKQNGLSCIVDSKSDTNKFTIYGTTAEEIGKCKFILSEIAF